MIPCRRISKIKCLNDKPFVSTATSRWLVSTGVNTRKLRILPDVSCALRSDYCFRVSLRMEQDVEHLWRKHTTEKTKRFYQGRGTGNNRYIPAILDRKLHRIVTYRGQHDNIERKSNEPSFVKFIRQLSDFESVKRREQLEQQNVRTQPELKGFTN